MDKLRGTSPDLTQDNVARLAELFPTVVTEARDEDGQVTRAVDFDLLRQELSDHVVEGPQERYHLDWPGKRAAAFAANAPTTATLRPDREESVDFDTTKNVFIEGDNLEVLKVLQESYLGKVKMIYIDPPYNTGNDFVYADDFAESTADYLQRSGEIDDDGARLRANPETNGRFHSDWLSMMYPRLKLARNLLTEDGAILASIGEREVSNLRAILNELFGETNFVGELVWEKKKKGAFLSSHVTNVKEYILVFCRDRSSFGGLIGEVTHAAETYPVIKSTNSRGIRTIPAGIASNYSERDHEVGAGTRLTSGNMEMILLSDLIIRDGRLAHDVEVESNWIYSQTLIDQFSLSGDLYITRDLYIRRHVREPRTKMLKDLLMMRGESTSGSTFTLEPSLHSDGWGTNEDAFGELHSILGEQNLMDFPKPSKLIAKLIRSVTWADSDAIILDFFAGSGTTGQAVTQLNAADGGRRQYLLVQLNEAAEESSALRRAGFSSISALSRERLRRSAAAVRETSGTERLDLGFRAFRLDASPFVERNHSADSITPDMLAELENPVLADRSPEDLLTHVLLAWGLDLSATIETVSLAGEEVYDVEDGALLAALGSTVSDELAHAMAERHPDRALFLDSGFVSDAARINVEQIFREVSPGTDVKVL